MKRNSQVGFTIVELLIVVVVIAILAAVVIVAYNGVRARAEASVLQSDLTASIKQVEMDRTTAGGLFTIDTFTQHFQSTSNDKTLTFRYGTPTSACFEITNTNNRTFFLDTAASASPAEGTCPTLVGFSNITTRCISTNVYISGTQNNYTSESLSIYVDSTYGDSPAVTTAAGVNETVNINTRTSSVGNGVIRIELKGINGSNFSVVRFQPYQGRSC
jgi:prepilin-type N-terminal cleavage/methylation domain-containing protein